MVCCSPAICHILVFGFSSPSLYMCISLVTPEVRDKTHILQAAKHGSALVIPCCEAFKVKSATLAERVHVVGSFRCELASGRSKATLVVRSTIHSAWLSDVLPAPKRGYSGFVCSK